jgi:hypothetical protein
MKRKRYKWGFDMMEETELSKKIRNKSELEQKELMKKILKKEPKKNPFAIDILHCARKFKEYYKRLDRMKLPKGKITKLLLVEEESSKRIIEYWEDNEYSGLLASDGIVRTKFLWLYIEIYIYRYNEVINMDTWKISRSERNMKLISELKQLKSTTKINSVSKETELYSSVNESHEPTIGGMKIEQIRRDEYLENSVPNKEMRENAKL